MQKVKHIITFFLLLLHYPTLGMEHQFPLVKQFIEQKLLEHTISPVHIQLRVLPTPPSCPWYNMGWKALGSFDRGVIGLNFQGALLLQHVLEVRSIPVPYIITDIVSSHAQAVCFEEIIIKSAAVALRHEIGHLHGKDWIIIMCCDLLLMLVRKLILLLVSPYAFSNTYSWQYIERKAVATYILFYILRQKIYQSIEERADDFAISGTRDPNELLATALLLKTDYATRKFSSCCATHPNAYARYKKFYHAYTATLK